MLAPRGIRPKRPLVAPKLIPSLALLRAVRGNQQVFISGLLTAEAIVLQLCRKAQELREAIAAAADKQGFSRLIHESIGNMGDGLNHRRKQMHAVKETIHSQLLPLPLHERGATEMFSLFGNKCIRGRLRFVRSYCRQPYAYSC